MKTPLSVVLQAAFRECAHHQCDNKSEIMAAIRALGGEIKHSGDDSTLTCDGQDYSVYGFNLCDEDNGQTFCIDGKSVRYGPMKFRSVIQRKIVHEWAGKWDDSIAPPKL